MIFSEWKRVTDKTMVEVSKFLSEIRTPQLKSLQMGINSKVLGKIGHLKHVKLIQTLKISKI